MKRRKGRNLKKEIQKGKKPQEEKKSSSAEPFHKNSEKGVKFSKKKGRQNRMGSV